MFPDRVRSVVIDGVLDPVVWTTGRPPNGPPAALSRSGLGDRPTASQAAFPTVPHPVRRGRAGSRAALVLNAARQARPDGCAPPGHGSSWSAVPIRHDSDQHDHARHPLHDPDVGHRSRVPAAAVRRHGVESALVRSGGPRRARRTGGRAGPVHGNAADVLNGSSARTW